MPSLLQHVQKKERKGKYHRCSIKTKAIHRFNQRNSFKLQKNKSGQITYQPGNLSVSQNGLQLSKGLKSKIVATSGNLVAYTNGETSDNPFHMHPDGAAVFQDPSGSGWVYMSNSEVDSANGGVARNSIIRLHSNIIIWLLVELHSVYQ